MEQFKQVSAFSVLSGRMAFKAWHGFLVVEMARLSAEVRSLAEASHMPNCPLLLQVDTRKGGEAGQSSYLNLRWRKKHGSKYIYLNADEVAGLLEQMQPNLRTHYERLGRRSKELNLLVGICHHSMVRVERHLAGGRGA